MRARVGILDGGGKGGCFDFGGESGYFTNMTKLGIAIADDEIGWAQARIATGEFANIDAYINQLIRRDRVENEETAWLQAEIDKGRASGLINRDASDVLREVMAVSNLLAIGNNDIAAGDTALAREVIARLKATAAATDM